MVTFYSPPKKQLTQRKIAVKIDSLDAFGQGVASYQGKTIFVKNALPTEQVDVQFTEDKKHYAKAKVIKWQSLSLERLKPACQHYGECGGCDMQHVSPDLQHSAKKAAFANLIKRETGYALDEHNISVIASTPYHYRRRARLSLMFDKTGSHKIGSHKTESAIGFRKAESNQIIDIKMCPVLVEELQSLLLPLKSTIAQLHNKKALGHIELISVDSGVIVVLRHTNPLNNADIALLKTFALAHDLSFYLHGDELVSITEEKTHYYHVGELQLRFNPLNFIQVNSEINTKMIHQAIDWLALNPQDNVLDLFCGMGNFSLPIAQLVNKVTGVEGIDELVEKAKLNTILNKSYLKGEADFFVQNLDEMANKPRWWSTDVNKVLLDPARAGANNLMESLIKLDPERIVYISCNPATLARDSKKLLQAGYSIVKVSILDMFPQTKHIESMLLFMKLGYK